MQSFELRSFPADDPAEAPGLERSLGDWFAERTYPVRLLAYSRPFDLRGPRALLRRRAAALGRAAALAGLARGGRAGADLEAAVRDIEAAGGLRPGAAGELAGLPEGPRGERGAALADALDRAAWPLPWVREADRFYEALQARHLRSATYLLLTWEPPSVSEAAIALTIRRAFRRDPVHGAPIPCPLAGPYLERDLWLQPERPGDPWLAALLAYDSRGTIDLAVLHPLLDRPYDVAVAVDVETGPPSRALARAERAHAIAQAAARGPVKDARAERQAAASSRALHELVHQNLHDVQVAVLLSGATRAELEAHVGEVAELLGGRLRLVRPPGVQRGLLELWSARPARQIDLPWRRRNVYSHGVGCYAGVVTYHRRASTDGLLWGVDGRRLAPLFLDLFRDGHAAHLVVLGKTGYGKTFFLNLMALRAAALAGYQVVMIDAFDNAARVVRAAGAGAGGCWLTLETPVNILEVVFGDGDGDWRAAQVEHAIGQLALLLGEQGGADPDGRAVRPRRFLPEERGVLDRALSALYAPDSARGQAPLLSDLVAELDRLGQPEGVAIADTLAKLLYGTADRSGGSLTRLGRRFNAPGQVDWSFERAITCFDLGQITAAAPEWLPFYYAQVIGAVNRFVRDPSRDRRRPTLLIVDEFGYAAQVASVARMAADMAKVARKYGVGLVVADQNPQTFDTRVGREIFENAAGKILFHLDPTAARLARELVSGLTERHAAFLSEAERGEAVAVFGRDVHVMLVEGSPLELRAFSGS